MSQEVAIKYTSGRTLYYQIEKSGQLCKSDLTFETPQSAHWSQYARALTESGTTGWYFADFPAVAAGSYQLQAFDQASGSPATSDSEAGSGELNWDGTAEISTWFGEDGSIVWEISLQRSSGGPLDGATVFVSKDAGGALRSRSKVTDDLGKVTFSLNPGVIYVWPYHPERVFSDRPYQETVA